MAALLNGGLQGIFGAAFGAVYPSGYLLRTTLTDDGEGGYSTSHAVHSIKGQVDQASERMRRAEGYTDGDMRIIVLQSGVTVEPNTDDLAILGGKVWALSGIQADPAITHWEMTGRLGVMPKPATSFTSPTADDTPTISGTGLAGASIDLGYGASTVTGAATVAVDGTWSAVHPELADGTYAIRARQTLGGVTSAWASGGNLLVDTTAPAVPVITTASPFVTTDTTPSIAGTMAADAVAVTIYLDGVEAGTATLGSGTWAYTFDELDLGVYTVTATATDALGNETAESTPLSLTVGYSWMEGGEVYGAEFSAGQYWRGDESALLAAVLATARASGASGINGSGVAKLFGNNAPVLLSGKGLDIWGASRLNKCQNFNANPTDLTNIALSGAATLTVVSDVAALAAAGLSEICSGGKVYRLDNSASGSASTATFAGTPGNLNQHVLSVWWRGSGNADLRFNNGGLINHPLGAAYARVSAVQAPNSAAFPLYINARPGAIVYFVLNQLEEGSIVFPPIVTTGAAATREASVETIPDFAALAASEDLGSGFSVRIKTQVSRLSDPAARVLAAFGADASNCCRIEIGTDNKVYAIVRKAGVNEVTLATANAWGTVPGEVEIVARFKPGDFSLAATGLIGDADADAETLPALTNGRLGSALDGTSYLRGPIELVTLKAA